MQFQLFEQNLKFPIPGGTAGCIVAARLAAADPNLSVLVIEAGQNNYNVPNVVTPVLFKEHLAPDSTTSTCYKGKKSEALLGREPTVPTGRILGGGSSINSMMWASVLFRGCS